MRVPEGMRAKELHTGIITANLQGINQKGDEMDHTKCDQLTQVIETTQANVILVGGGRGASAQECPRILERPSGDQQEGTVRRSVVQGELGEKSGGSAR